MQFVNVDWCRRIYAQLSTSLLLFALSGCLSEETITPIPGDAEPLPPSIIVCAPFIKSGYTDKMSYFPGEKVKLFLDSKEFVALCKVTIYDVNDDSVFSLASELPLLPPVAPDASMNGFNFPVAAEFELPEIKSGIYLIEKKIPFIVRSNLAVDVMIVYASNTANAYATSGGKSLYSLQERPAAVSFLRPVPLQPLSEQCLKWFTSLEGMTLGYMADIDLDDFETVSHPKVLVIPGHSEYWTRKARQNFDGFVNSGGHALILSGNTMWWQVRYSEDRSRMYCYKNVDLDPIRDPLLKTIEWNSTSLDYPILSSIGAHFPLGGYGQRQDEGWNGYKIVTPGSPLFEGLSLKKGDIISLPSLEYDGSPLSGYDAEGYPILDTQALGFEKIELLGFDKGVRVNPTTATFIVFKKSAHSGIVINTSTTDWCSSGGMGGASGATIKAITYNALAKLVNNEPVFSN